MKEDKKNASRELPNAPHFAKRVGIDTAIENWITGLKGRRDARTTPPDASGHHPLTRTLHSHVDHVEAIIHDALIAALRPIDNDIARAEAQIRRLEENKKSFKQQSADHPATAEERATPQGQESLREKDKISSKTAVVQAQQDSLATDVVQLIEHREKLHEAARAILETWQARYAALTGCHRRAFIRKATTASGRRRLGIKDPQALALPRHASNHSWASGGRLPLTITVISADDPVLSWTRRS
ncbi:hypothetical protein [Arthrobacter sp. H14-L1]|uniref:hypothetical protein n=1 Tax=Arthrobacter sp. H14-L1 TaxID=2996697 RepID=UPI002271C7E2|nr:hypothetical protein [Arthrobacter sp. H14-L1]MCY0905757.1 hypothetical protein [Arthrobacter sp. H14-L1]